MQFVEILRDDKLLAKARVCDTFLSESRGYMFRRPSGPFFFRLPGESRILAGIHMLFVFFPLQASWFDDRMAVVDVKVAKPWRAYWPRSPARYLIETPLEESLPIQRGDRLKVRPCLA